MATKFLSFCFFEVSDVKVRLLSLNFEVPEVKLMYLRLTRLKEVPKNRRLSLDGLRFKHGRVGCRARMLVEDPQRQTCR